MTVQPAPFALIADADPYICRVFEAKLTKDGAFRAIGVTASQDALLAASRDVFAAILWDLGLRNTARMLPRVRAICPDAVLLLLTTDDRPTIDANLARLDISDVLVKPFNLDTLVDSIRAAVEGLQLIPRSSPLDIARVGQRLELISESGICDTRVSETGQDTFVVVGAPRVEVPGDFRSGLEVSARVSGDDAVYTFKTQLVRAIQDPVGAWEVTKPRTIRRNQRRRSPRRSLNLAISLKVSRAGQHWPTDDMLASAGVDESPESIHGKTQNIGLGGCLLVSDRELPTGTDVQFTLSQSGEQIITGTGMVTRSVHLMRVGSRCAGPGYQLALRFGPIQTVGRRRLRETLDPTL